MPAPLSEDLRVRVVRLYKKGVTTYEDVAELLDIGRASVSRYLRMDRELGSVAPKPATGGVPAVLEGEPRRELVALVEKHPDETLEQLRRRWVAEHPDLVVSVRTFGREVQAAGFTRKKKRFERRSVTPRK